MKVDHSTTNPGLHALYVHRAMHQLRAINKSIHRLNKFSNLNLTYIIAGMVDERHKLIMNNTAYRDAAAQLMAGIEPGPYLPDPKDIIDKADPASIIDVPEPPIRRDIPVNPSLLKSVIDALIKAGGNEHILPILETMLKEHRN